MNQAQRDFSKIGFAKTFLLPGVLIFLVPVISLLFFLHAQNRYDSEGRETILAKIRSDSSLSPEQRQEAIAFFSEHPISELVESEEVGGQMDSRVAFDFATFRWMIRLSALSIVGGIAVYLLGGICVWLSRGSQRAQYFSITTGWQLLRLYGAFQVIAQGVMLVALSYWVTALWMHVFSVKLIIVVAILAVCGAGTIILTIFKRPKIELHVEGKVLDRAGSPRLWEDLEAICAKVGTGRPDNVIVGIDDNFFATENPVHVDGAVCRGRTLFASLALLKQMSGAEADAVLAHEMAHFSGKDTLYSKKIAPSLAKYGQYLQALYENPMARPVFYFMNSFRALFELSLGQQSRTREFRADRIASETASSQSFASALLRIAAYSDYRAKVQQNLFGKDQMGAANISAQLEQGFPEHAKSFATNPSLGGVATAHPFDTHPPLAQRLDAIGVPIQSRDIAELIASPGDGRWFQAIDDAEQLESSQWARYEEGFRAFHEQSLAYRYLPGTEDERAVVLKFFPELSIEGKKGSLAIDCEGLHYSAWPGKIAYSEIVGITMDDHTFRITYPRGNGKPATIPTNTFGKSQVGVIQAVQVYYNRYLVAADYRKQKREQDAATTAPAPTTDAV